MDKTSYRLLTLTVSCMLFLSTTAEQVIAWPCPSPRPPCHTCMPTGWECLADCGCGGRTCPDGVHYSCIDCECICDAGPYYTAHTVIDPVSITSPTDGDSFCVGENVSVTCSTSTDTDKYHRCVGNVWTVSSVDDLVTHTWSGPGTFNPTTGTSVTWTPPSTSGEYTITVTASDSPLYNESDPTDSVTVYVVEVDGVRAGGKTTDQTLFLANDYLDEPAKREPLDQDVIADLVADTLAVSTAPDSFSWSPVCGSLPKICPDDANGATFTAKDHDLYSITATCCSSSESMSIAIEGINIYTANISSPDEMDKTYNIFLNNNFDQQRESSTLPGHKQCYYMDNSDDSLTNPNNDNMIEIGTINLFAYTGGDTDASVTFDSSGIKLYDSSKNKLEFDTVYKIVDLGPPYWIYVEGTLAGTPTLTATIETQDDYTAIDELKIKVIPLNLIAVDPAPISDEHEICHKDKLVIRVNNNDSDNDGTVDLGLDFNVVGGDPDLAHVILEKPSNVVASDISGSITVTFPANVNAFNNQDKTGGSAPTTYSLSDLPKNFYLEGKSASSDILDSSVTVEMTLDSGVKCHDEIRYTVIQVDILNPEGSLNAAKNPEASWVSSPPYHFDFQGLISTATGPYVLGINGDIEPTPPLGYKWTLDAAAGTLSNDTTATPTHTAPATEGQGMLTLKAIIDTTDTGLKDEKQVKIYKDHLERDYANFETGGSCKLWKVTTFNVDPQPAMFWWNCHGATRHAYNGTYSSSHTSQPWLSWSVKTVVVTQHDSSGNGSHPSLGTLERGDVVAYFSPNGKPYNPPNISDLSSWIMQHSQTCTGSGDETYGANNEPKSFPGAPGEDQSWKWATSPAGDWGIHIWQPGLQGIYVPFIIVVFDKP